MFVRPRIKTMKTFDFSKSESLILTVPCGGEYLYEPNASDKQLSFLVFVHGFKEVSLGIVCMRTFIRNTSLASFRVGSFAWELSFGILRFETFVWNLSVDSLRLGPAFFAVWNLWIGNFARHCAF